MQIEAFSVAHPSGFEPKAFRLGVNKGVFSIGCCDVLLCRKIQEYQEKKEESDVFPIHAVSPDFAPFQGVHLAIS